MPIHGQLTQLELDTLRINSRSLRHMTSLVTSLIVEETTTQKMYINCPSLSLTEYHFSLNGIDVFHQ